MYRSYSLRDAEGALEEVEEPVEEGLAGGLADHHHVVALQLGRGRALLESVEVVYGDLDLPGRRPSLEAHVAPVRHVLDSARGEDRLLGGVFPRSRNDPGRSTEPPT